MLFRSYANKEGDLKMMGCNTVSKKIFDNVNLSSIPTLLNFSYGQNYSFSDFLEDKVTKNIENDGYETLELYKEWCSEIINRLINHSKTNIFIYNKLIPREMNETDEYLIYNKLPERLIYGALKYENNIYPSKVNIFLDKSWKYEQFMTQVYLKNHLNALAKYRTLNYYIESVALIPKNKDEKPVIDDHAEKILRTETLALRNQNMIKKSMNKEELNECRKDRKSVV